MIHADLFPDNVFFRDGRFAGGDRLLLRLRRPAGLRHRPSALNAWCFEPDGSFNVTAARAFVAGYESRRPLSPDERAALPILAWGAAMRFFLTRLARLGRDARPARW